MKKNTPLSRDVIKEFYKNFLTGRKWTFNLWEIVQNKHPDTNIILIEGPRGCGKTFGSQQLVKNDVLFKPGKRFSWIRNLQSQAEASLNSFVERFKEYGVQGKYKDGLLIDHEENIKGNYIGLRAAARVRSGINFNVNYNGIDSEKLDELKNIKTDYIIYDEYNEFDINFNNIYNKIVQLITTIERGNPDCLFILIGNRDSATNPFLHKLGVAPHKDFKKTKIEIVKNEFGQCEIYRLGIDDIHIYRNKRSIANFLASKDPNLNRFLIEGGFLFEGTENVLNYDVFIKPTFEPKYKLIIEGVEYFFGNFVYENENKIALSINAAYDHNTDIVLALDNWSYLNPKSIKTDDNTTKELVNLIFYAYKTRALYFDEFEILENFKRIFKNLV